MKTLLFSGSIVFIAFILGFAFSWFMPSHRTITTYTNKVQTISIVAEKEKCKKLGGSFYLIPTSEEYFTMTPMAYSEDNLGWTIGCEQLAKPLFNYTINQ